MSDVSHHLRSDGDEKYLISNQENVGTSFSEYEERILDITKIKMVKDIAAFKESYKDIMEDLKQYYTFMKVKFGVISYWS